MRSRLSILTLLLAAGPLAAGPASSSTPQPGGEELPRHELVFARHSDSARTDYEVWRICADGTQLASLVVEPGHQFQISVSPDGEAFAYTSPVDGKRDIFRRPFGRGETVNLTHHPADDGSPAWSPDGGRMAFFSDRDAEKPELYVLELATGATSRHTRNELYESGAAWIPDGNRVLTRFFPAPEGGKHEGRGKLFLLDLATGEETQLTRLGGYNGDPAISPDGSRIAFHRTADGGSEIWLANADGSNPHPITRTYVDEYTPRWSPDGRWIAFTAGVGHDGLGTFDLWLMRPDGTDRRLLSGAANTEGWHQWRPGEHYCR